MKHSNPEMLLRIAQGDAYCMATEYIRFPRDDELREEAMKIESYLKHPVHQLDAGMYTDDTQMSLAVAEFILSGEEPTKLGFANAFMKAFLRDPRDGYSRGFQAILNKTETGEELLEKLIPTSTKNGAAMRSVPLGVLPSVDDVMRFGRIQASVTHDTPEGIASSQIIGLLSHFALYTDDSFDQIADDIRQHFPQYDDVFTDTWLGPVANHTQNGGHDVGINTVHAVVTLLREETSLVGMLQRIISWGGDTDSVAAIAWGIASIRMRDELPEFLEHGLEPSGNYGVTYLKGLGRDLMERFDEST